jgi:hypothetical protein
MANVKVYAEKDEYWPWYDLRLEDGYGWADEMVEIPEDLWTRYQEASEEYWKLKYEILKLAGIKDG